MHCGVSKQKYKGSFEPESSQPLIPDAQVSFKLLISQYLISGSGSISDFFQTKLLQLKVSPTVSTVATEIEATLPMKLSIFHSVLFKDFDLEKLL